jgi:hypothetical protein
MMARILILAAVAAVTAAASPRRAAGAPARPAPKLTMGEPVMVVMGPPEEKRWGFYQFPHLERWEDGRIALTFSLHRDEAESYGQPAPAPNLYVSSDEGRTWAVHTGPPGKGGLLLPNGDRLKIVTPKPVPVAELKLPPSVGVHGFTYDKSPNSLYRLKDLPDPLDKVYLSRLARGGSAWIEERALLRDPLALRYALRGIFPVVWWGDIRIAADRSLIAGIYPGYMEGQPRFPWNIFFYRSTDAGRSWDVQGRLLYEPDLGADPKGNERDGFSEPTFEILRDRSLLAVVRTTDGRGVGPMYLARSSDRGKTWTKPQVFAPTGVLPHLLPLAGGSLVLTSGRPGVDVRVSFDGLGKSWSDPQRLVPVTSERLNADSCGYTGLMALGRTRFLVAYSWFKAPDGEGRPRKTIFVRRFTIE